METVCVDSTTASTMCVTGSMLSMKMKTEVVNTSEENITLRVEPNDIGYECVEFDMDVCTKIEIYAETESEFVEAEVEDKSPEAKKKSAWEYWGLRREPKGMTGSGSRGVE